MLVYFELKPLEGVIDVQIPFSALYEKVQEILNIKVEEFQYLGYPSITPQDLWGYCIEKTWRKKDVENLRLHELTSGIFGASASQVLNYLQVKDLKQPGDLKLSKEEINFIFEIK